MKNNENSISYKKYIIYIEQKLIIVNTFKLAFHYIFNVVILFKTVFYLKFIFILKMNQKTFSLKNLEEI